MAAAAASPSSGSARSSPRSGEELNPTTTSRLQQPAGKQEQPTPQEQDPGYQTTGISPSSSSSSQPPSTQPTLAPAMSPARPTPPTSAAPKVNLRHSQSDLAANAAAVAATGRGPTPRASAKKGNSAGAGGGTSEGSGGDAGGGGSINTSSGGGEGVDRSGSTRPSSAAGGESSRMGAERKVDSDGDPDYHGGDASVFPRMLARNAPDSRSQGPRSTLTQVSHIEGREGNRREGKKKKKKGSQPSSGLCVHVVGSNILRTTFAYSRSAF